MGKAQTRHRLLVADNAAHTKLVEETLAEIKADCICQMVEDGEEALNMLEYRGSQIDMVWLGQDIPKQCGLEVLKQLKEHIKLKRIPVIVFADKDDNDTVREAYLAHANALVVKPKDTDACKALIRELWDYWTGIVQLPLAFR